MKNKYAIIGGDLRNAYLAKLLKEENEIFTFALEKSKQINLLNKCDKLDECIEFSDIIISAMPFSKDNKYVNTPLSDNKILIEDFLKKISKKTLIAGKLDKEILKQNKIKFYDIFEFEEYSILNAIPSAEGAIQIAMEEYPKTLCGSKILIMGFGRIGKILSKMLNAIGADVYCEARKSEDLAYIKAYGYKPINLLDLDIFLNQFDIIINNIPTLILNEKRLDLVKEDVLIIDLASSPGGIDFEYAKMKNIKVIWALGLPGKVAPLSSAEYIKKVIERNL